MTSRITCPPAAESPRRRIRRLTNLMSLGVILAGSLSLAGCTTTTGSGPYPGRSTAVHPGVITATNIYASGATTALQAIERLRPLFLISKVDLAPGSEREVFLNGVRLGGIRELRLIPASSVQEIRFVRSIDGGGTGSGRVAAILVISKAGR